MTLEESQIPPAPFPVPTPPPIWHPRPPTLACSVCHRAGTILCECTFAAYCSAQHQKSHANDHAEACESVSKAHAEWQCARQRFLDSAAEDWPYPYDVEWFPESAEWHNEHGRRYRSAAWALSKCLAGYFISTECDRWPIRLLVWLYEQSLPFGASYVLLPIRLAALYPRLGFDQQAYAMLEFDWSRPRGYRTKLSSYRDITESRSDPHGLLRPLQDVENTADLAIDRRLMVVFLRMRFLLDVQDFQNLQRIFNIQRFSLPPEVVEIILMHTTGPQLAAHPNLCGYDARATQLRSEAIVNLRQQIVRLLWPVSPRDLEVLMHPRGTRIASPASELPLDKRIDNLSRLVINDLHALWHESHGPLIVVGQFWNWAKTRSHYRAKHYLAENQMLDEPVTRSALFFDQKLRPT